MTSTILNIRGNSSGIDPVSDRRITNGLALCDLDNTLRQTVSGETFINDDYKDQQIFSAMTETTLKELKSKGFYIAGVSNQGGVEAGYKTLEFAIKEMRYFLDICPNLDVIHFAPNTIECWTITRYLTFLDILPLRFNTFSRYMIRDDKAIDLFRKPGTARLRYAIACWIEKYKLIDEETILPIDWANINFSEESPSKLLDKTIFMTGDRDEDEQAAVALNIPFIGAEEFRKGNIASDVLKQ